MAPKIRYPDHELRRVRAQQVIGANDAGMVLPRGSSEWRQVALFRLDSHQQELLSRRVKCKFVAKPRIQFPRADLLSRVSVPELGHLSGAKRETITAWA